MKPITDPVIDEIRETRQQISASFDHDPAKLVAYLMRYQEQFKDRLICSPEDQTPRSVLAPSTGTEIVTVQPVSIP